MMPHPFMPDLSGKNLDDLIKEMNDMYAKLRFVRNNDMRGQIQMVINGYQAEYQKRLKEEADKPKGKNKNKENKDG